MKRIILLFTAVLAGISAGAQGVNFENTAFEKALDKARAENKLVFLDAFTTWCGPCKMMVRDVFPKKEAGDFMNANYVNISIDMEKGEGPALAKKYNIQAYPTLLFLSPSGEVLHTRVGGADTAGFIQEAVTAKDPSKRLPALEKKYSGGNRDLGFMALYIKALANAYKMEEAQKAGGPYLEKMSDADLLTEDGFAIASISGVQYKSRIYNYMMNNKDLFVKSEKIGKDSYDMVISQALDSHVAKISETGTLDELKSAIDGAVKEYDFGDYKESMISGWYDNYYISHKMYTEWLDKADAKITALAASDKKKAAYTAINTAYYIATDPVFAGNKKVYDRAEAMAKRAMEIDSSATNANYCLAELYKTQGRKAEALEAINAYIKTIVEQEELSRPLEMKAEIEKMQ